MRSRKKDFNKKKYVIMEDCIIYKMNEYEKHNNERKMDLHSTKYID